MSAGIDANNSSVASMTPCSCQQPPALFLVVDLNAFQHEPQVEEHIENFSDSSSLSGLAEADISSSSSSDGSVPNVQKLMPAQTPDFIDVVPEVKLIPTLPSVVQALHQFKADIAKMKIAAAGYCECPQMSIVELSPSVPPQGHVNGGALMSTANCKECLWSHHQCSDKECSKTT